MSPPPRRTRLSIDVSTESRRRIRMAAARRDQSIRDYVWEAVASRLDRDAPATAAAKSLSATAAPDSGAAAASLSAGGKLTGRADPVLAALWMNAEDAIYDDM